MPRQGRVVLPNYPLHVVQRGHNRQVVFAEDEDYQRYLSDTGPQGCLWYQGLRILLDDQPCPSALGAW